MHISALGYCSVLLSRYRKTIDLRLSHFSDSFAVAEHSLVLKPRAKPRFKTFILHSLREISMQEEERFAETYRKALGRIYVITSRVLQPPPDATPHRRMVTVTHDYETEHG